MANITTVENDSNYQYYDYRVIEPHSDDWEKYHQFRWVLWKVIQPTLSGIGLLCNIIVSGVVVATPALRRQYPRAVHVIWMAFLDCCCLILIEVQRHEGVSYSCVAIRAWIYLSHLVHFSPLLLAVVACEPYVADVFPKLGRKLSTPLGANVPVIVLLAFFALYGLGPTINLSTSDFGYCIVRDPELHNRLLLAIVFLNYGVSLIMLATAGVAVLCVGRWRLKAAHGTPETEDPIEPASTLPYERLEETGGGSQSAANGTVASNVPAVDPAGRNALLWAALVFTTILLGPLIVLISIQMYQSAQFNWSPTTAVIADIIYYMIHHFYALKILVYLAGWSDFRAGCWTALSPLRSCHPRCGGPGHRSSLPVEMADADGNSETESKDFGGGRLNVPAEALLRSPENES